MATSNISYAEKVKFIYDNNLQNIVAEIFFLNASVPIEEVVERVFNSYRK